MSTKVFFLKISDKDKRKNIQNEGKISDKTRKYREKSNLKDGLGEQTAKYESNLCPERTG